MDGSEKISMCSWFAVGGGGGGEGAVFHLDFCLVAVTLHACLGF